MKKKTALAYSRKLITLKASVKNLQWLAVFVAMFTLILSGGLYYVLNSSARKTLIERMHLREEVVSKAGAQSISAFIKLFGNSLALLAENQEIISRGSKSQEVLDNFVETLSEAPINGVLFVDKAGKPLLISTKTEGVLEDGAVSLVDRDYFIWAKGAKKSEVFIGRPIIPRVGNLGKQYIIPVATPVFKEDAFDGLLVSSVLLTELTEEYLEPIKISDNTIVFLADSSGTILYSPFEKLIGENYIEYLENNPFLGSKVVGSYLREKLESVEAGKLDLALPDERKGGLTRFLIAYTPIFYNHNHLILAIGVPADEALAYIAPIYINQLGVLLVGFFAILLLTIAFIKFRNRRNHKDNIEK